MTGKYCALCTADRAAGSLMRLPLQLVEHISHERSVYASFGLQTVGPTEVGCGTWSLRLCPALLKDEHNMLIPQAQSGLVQVHMYSKFLIHPSKRIQAGKQAGYLPGQDSTLEGMGLLDVFMRPLAKIQTQSIQPLTWCWCDIRRPSLPLEASSFRSSEGFDCRRPMRSGNDPDWLRVRRGPLGPRLSKKNPLGLVLHISCQGSPPIATSQSN